MSSRRATEMFQFARGPPLGLCIQPRVSRHDSGWVAPFGSSGLLARMQLPLNVSPVSASFFGLQRRGIHLVLSRACLFMRVCASRPHDRSCTCAPSSSLFSLSSRLFSALGKIEVILCYSVFQVHVREALTTGKWKHNGQPGLFLLLAVCGWAAGWVVSDPAADRPGMAESRADSECP